MYIAQISYAIVDYVGARVSTRVKIPATTSLDAAVAFGQALALLIDPVIDGQIISITVIYHPDKIRRGQDLPDGLKHAPLSYKDGGVSHAQQSGLLTFSLHDSPYHDSVLIPTWKKSLKGPKGIIVRFAYPAVDNLIDALANGLPVVGGTIVRPCGMHGEALYKSFDSGKWVIRKVGKTRRA